MLVLKFNIVQVLYYTMIYLVLSGMLGFLSDQLGKVLLRGSPPYVMWQGWTWLDLVLTPPVSPLVDAVYGVVVIPLVEEGLLIGIPLTVFDSPLLALAGAVTFSLLHAVPIAEACRRYRLPRTYLAKALFVNQIYHMPLAVYSWYLWTHGYAWLSIVLHMVNNALATVGEYRTKREKERQIAEWLRDTSKKRHAPYLESYVPVREDEDFTRS